MYGFFYLNRLNIAPVIPLIIVDLKLSYTQMGFITASFYGVYTFSQTLAGYLGDRLGPRKVITLGGLCSALSNLIFSQMGTLPLLLGLHASNGVGQSGGWAPSVKLLVNWFPKEKLGFILGLFTTSISLFTVLAYLISGYLGQHFGWRIAFIFPSILLALLCLFYWITVRDFPSEVGLKGVHVSPLKRTVRGDFSLLIRNRQMWTAFLSAFCLLYIQYGGMVWFPTYLQGTFHTSVLKAGILASVFPLMGIVARPLGGILSDRLFKGENKPLILIGMGIVIISLMILSRTKDIRWVVFLMALIGFSYQSFSFLIFTLPSRMLPPSLVSTGNGFLDTGGHLGSLMAMLISGWLIDHFKSYSAVLIVFWMIGLVGFFSVLLMKEERREP